MLIEWGLPAAIAILIILAFNYFYGMGRFIHGTVKNITNIWNKLVEVIFKWVNFMMWK